MTITTIEIQSSDGTRHEIVGDLIDSRFYPIYRLGDGEDLLSFFGDGDTVDREDADGTVGASKTTVAAGVDQNDKLRFLRLSPGGDLSVSLNEDTGREILKELKKLNLHMSKITDLQISNAEID